ncbi:MAG: Hpt domain-containing protein [Minwuia sp.]|uniref:Hpt domain-containing protein n=1 Tax=Minwuia sp. TaxID=2493630 RepID=UPI003A8606C0
MTAAREKIQEAPVLDDGMLSELAGGADGSVVSSLVEGFLEESEERIRAIRRAVAADNIEAIGFQAHALKSTAATYGAMRLGEMAAALERMAKTGDSSTAREQSDSIEAVWPLTRAAFTDRFLSG